MKNILALSSFSMELECLTVNPKWQDILLSTSTAI